MKTISEEDLNALISAQVFLEMLWPIISQSPKIMAKIGREIGTLQ